MPLLIGMLPSVGGAYFSAPMVDEATKDLPMSPEEKAFANYWYRHPWEYILPLYPGIVLASAITEIPLRTYILINLPYALTMFLSGFFFLSKAKGAFRAEGSSRMSLRSFTPIVVLLVLVAVLGVPLHWGLLGLVVVMLLYWRYDLKGTSQVVKHGLSVNVILLTIGVILFKEVLEVSGAVENLSRFFSESGIPILSVLFVLPFVTGVLTGVTIGFVGAAFPLLVSLVGHSLPALTFAFASGFVGVLLSPVHVCLVLTKEYFHADMGGIYRRTVPLTGLVILVALVEFFLLSGTLAAR
jgi:integral membrane protein (TIGR00529 family)